MSFASRVRGALPLRIQPFARYHYERWRGLLERELPLFCDLVRPGDHVVDVGANYGIYVHALRRRGARVEAFEPQPVCADVLRAYAAADRAVAVHQVALGATESNARLEVPVVDGRVARGSASIAHGAGDGAEQVDVQVRPLDAFEFSDVRAVKIDVEGAELEVLAGATETLERCRPTMLIEVEQRHHRGPIDRVFAQISALGYEGTFLLPGAGMRPISEFRIEEHQPESALAGGEGLYVNNFLFRPTRA